MLMPMREDQSLSIDSFSSFIFLGLTLYNLRDLHSVRGPPQDRGQKAGTLSFTPDTPEHCLGPGICSGKACWMCERAGERTHEGVSACNTPCIHTARWGEEMHGSACRPSLCLCLTQRPRSGPSVFANPAVILNGGARLSSPSVTMNRFHFFGCQWPWARIWDLGKRPGGWRWDMSIPALAHSGNIFLCYLSPFGLFVSSEMKSGGQKDVPGSLALFRRSLLKWLTSTHHFPKFSAQIRSFEETCSRSSYVSCALSTHFPSFLRWRALSSAPNDTKFKRCKLKCLRGLVPPNCLPGAGAAEQCPCFVGRRALCWQLPPASSRGARASSQWDTLFLLKAVYSLPKLGKPVF